MASLLLMAQATLFGLETQKDLPSGFDGFIDGADEFQGFTSFQPIHQGPGVVFQAVHHILQVLLVTETIDTGRILVVLGHDGLIFRQRRFESPGFYLVDGKSGDFNGAEFTQNGDGAFQILGTGGSGGLDNPDGAIGKGNDRHTGVFGLDVHQGRAALGKDRYRFPHHPFQQIHMVTGLVGEDAAIHGPGAPPGILIVIVLRATPAHPNRPHHQATEPPLTKRLPQLDHGEVVAILLDHKELDPRPVTGLDHPVGILKTQCHGLFHHQMFAMGSNIDGDIGVFAAFGQNVDHLDLRVFGQHLQIIRIPGNPIFLTKASCLFQHQVTNRHQVSPQDGATQQFCMFGGDSAAADEGEIDFIHHSLRIRLVTILNIPTNRIFTSVQKGCFFFSFK